MVRRSGTLLQGANYYRLTRKGRRHLQSAATSWRQYAEAVFEVLDHS